MIDAKIILKNSSRTNVSKHIPSVFSISTISVFQSVENKHDVWIMVKILSDKEDKTCKRKFCEFLREHAMKILNFKKKKNGIIN